MEAFGPEIEFRLVSAAVGGDDFRGREGFRQWGRGGRGGVRADRDRVSRSRGRGRRSGLAAQLAGTRRASGIETAIEYSAVFTLDQGKIVRYREFPSRKAALEAAGLREQAMSEK
jgi:hypothetical protein